jgi:predicted ester cyclase
MDFADRGVGRDLRSRSPKDRPRGSASPIDRQGGACHEGTSVVESLRARAIGGAPGEDDTEREAEMADAREIAARFVDAFNAHDEDGIRALNTESSFIEAPGDVRVEGKQPTTAYAMSWLNAFPDARITVHNEIVDGAWVAQRFTFEGTHEGILASPAGEIPPTHRRLTGRGAQLLRVEGDAVAETHLYFDQVQVMTQLGLMPEAAEAARA